MFVSARAAAGIAFSTLVLTGCFLLPREEQRMSPPVVAPPEIKYQTTTVVRETLAERIEVLAYFQPAEEHPLYFEYSGARIRGIYCSLGERVFTGQLLAELDVPELSSDYRRRVLLLEKAEIALERMRVTGADRYQVRSAEIDVELRAIDRDDAALAVSSSILRSPIEGLIVYLAGLEPGDAVERFRTIIRVADSDTLQLIYAGGAAKRFRTGMAVNVTIGDTVMAGEVLSSPEDVPPDAPIIEKDRIVFSLAADPEEVERGDLAAVSAVLWEKADVIAVPNRLLHTYKDQPFVNVLRDGIKREQPVAIGVATQTMTEIVEGLEVGDQLLR